MCVMVREKGDYLSWVLACAEDAGYKYVLDADEV
jgi:hypothetical protein